MAEKLEFDLAVKNNQLDKALDQGTKKAISLEGALETALGVLGGGLAIKAFDGLISGFDALISVGKEAIDAAAAQEVATNNLNNALARQGNFTKKASEELLAFANTVQKTTTFEDDAIIANAALLESLTGLSKNGLKQGINAATDFATVLGVDLESATRLVGKAAEGNVEAFKRYGVEIKKGSSDAESFTNTIEALNRQFGGASAAQLNTYSGSLKALGNAYGDLLEPVGEIIVKNPVVVSLFNEIRKSINEANTEVTGLVPTLQELVTDGFIIASVAAQQLLQALDFLTVAFKALLNSFQAIGGGIAQAIVEPIKLLIDGLIFLGDKIPGVGDAFGGLVNPLDEASEALNNFTVNGIEGLKASTDGNIFRSAQEGLDSLTNSTLENAAAVAIAKDSSVKNNEDAKNSAIETDAAIVKSRIEAGNALIAAQAQLAIEESTFRANQDILNLESQDAKDAANLQRIYDRAVLEAEAVYQGELLKNKVIEDQQTKLALNLAAADKLEQTKIKASGDFKIAEAKRVADREKIFNDAKIKDQGEAFATIATLANSNNKTLATIGKAAALTQIAISGPVAVTRAFEAFPPPFSFAAAAAVGAAVAAQAAKVVGVSFASGGFINGEGGATAGADNTMANLRKGEMVLNGDDQKTLFDAIKSGGLGGGNIQVIIDGREIAVAVRNQINSGFRLA